MAEEFRLVMQKSEWKVLQKWLEKKKENLLLWQNECQQKKTVNEFEWMDLMAKKLQPDKRMFE